MAAASGSPVESGGVEVVELRRYRLHPGSRESLIDLFDREFVEPQEVLGMRVIGPFRDLDAPDDFVWLRGFTSMPVRAAALEAFYTGPVWAAYKDQANGTMINSDNVLLLRTATADRRFSSLTGRRAPREATGALDGLITTTICHLAPRTDEAFVGFFETSIRPHLEQTFSKVLATFVVERSANTFPRLPVREGETVFVWLSAFPSEAAYDAHLGALAATEAWTRSVFPEMDRRVWRPNQVARLVPTAR